MSKLFKLKEWLTVPEAAQYLTVVFGEIVLEADVLRLALNDKLQLSVNFVNGFFFDRWKTIPKNQFEDGGRIATLAESYIYEFENGNYVSNDEHISITGTHRFGRGVFDFLMIGNGQSVIENCYQKLTNGIEINASESDGGIFLKDGSSICEIQIPNHEIDGEYMSALYLAYDGFLVVRTKSWQSLIHLRARPLPKNHLQQPNATVC